MGYPCSICSRNYDVKGGMRRLYSARNKHSESSDREDSDVEYGLIIPYQMELYAAQKG